MSALRRVGRAVVLVAIVSLGSGAAADSGWKKIGDDGGISLERRQPDGMSFYELRATTRIAAPPEVVLDAIWSGVFGELPKSVRKREILKQSEHELVFYDQLSAPVVTDRDYTLRFWRATGTPPERAGLAPADARWLLFETANSLGPPPLPRYVRVPVIRGAWAVSPDGSGGSLLTYVCYSDPGGSIPAWLARGAQKDQFLVDVRRIVQRSTERPKR